MALSGYSADRKNSSMWIDNCKRLSQQVRFSKYITQSRDLTNIRFIERVFLNLFLPKTGVLGKNSVHKAVWVFELPRADCTECFFIIKSVIVEESSLMVNRIIPMSFLLCG